jgi:hypothetical protein
MHRPLKSIRQQCASHWCELAQVRLVSESERVKCMPCTAAVPCDGFCGEGNREVIVCDELQAYAICKLCFVGARPIFFLSSFFTINISTSTLPRVARASDSNHSHAMA